MDFPCSVHHNRGSRRIRPQTLLDKHNATDVRATMETSPTYRVSHGTCHGAGTRQFPCRSGGGVCTLHTMRACLWIAFLLAAASAFTSAQAQPARSEEPRRPTSESKPKAVPKPTGDRPAAPKADKPKRAESKPKPPRMGMCDGS
jgi:hypothetical protein